MSDDVEHVITVSRMQETGGTGRTWLIDEATYDAIVAFLPDVPDESNIFTPEDMERAEEFCSHLITLDGGECDA